MDDSDLNRQVEAWVNTVANVRVHGTTQERPVDRLEVERAHLQPVPGPERLTPFLREDRKVGRDGYIQWERSWYGVSCALAGQSVQVQEDNGTVQIWAGDRRLIVHPRATRPGQRFTAPGQWSGLEPGDGRPRKEPLALQLPSVEVQRRSLELYDALTGGVVHR